jgi:hypothetical protein
MQSATFQVAGCFSKGQECATCFKFAADSDLGFKEIHVDRAGDVMAEAGSADGSAPDIHHQPPGNSIYIYCNYSYYYIIAGSAVVIVCTYLNVGSSSTSAMFYF